MDLSIFGIESTSTALVAVLTGVALVVLGLTTAALIGPRSYAPQKGEPYVCVFLFVLILGLAYAWRKGALQWK